MTSIKSMVLYSKLVEDDGGYLYMERQSKVLFEGCDSYVLSSRNGIVGYFTRIYLGRIYTKIRRLGFFSFINSLIEKFLARSHAQHFLQTVNLNQPLILVCMSEHILSFLVAEQLKLRSAKLSIHFSMLDLPWSYNSSEKYRYNLRKKFIKKFLSSVDSADFVSPAMQDLFIKEGFKGSSLVTYSGIELVTNKNSLLETDLSIESIFRDKLVHTGGLRARKEIYSICDQFIGNSLTDGQLISIDHYGTHKIDHEVVSSHTFLELDKIRKTLSKYELGLVPMSFKKSDLELVENSFPGKAWLYCMNGVIPVIFAPKCSAISVLFKHLGLGYVIDDYSKIHKIRAIKLSSEQIKKQLQIINEFHVNLADSFKTYILELKNIHLSLHSLSSSNSLKI